MDLARTHNINDDLIIVDEKLRTIFHENNFMCIGRYFSLATAHSLSSPGVPLVAAVNMA